MFIRFDVIHERDIQTDGRTLRDSKDRAYASHRAVKTRNEAGVKNDRIYSPKLDKISCLHSSAHSATKIISNL